MDYTYFSTAAAGPTPNQSFHPYGGGLPAPPHDPGHQTQAGLFDSNTFLPFESYPFANPHQNPPAHGAPPPHGIPPLPPPHPQTSAESTQPQSQSAAPVSTAGGSGGCDPANVNGFGDFGGLQHQRQQQYPASRNVFELSPSDVSGSARTGDGSGFGSGSAYSGNGGNGSGGGGGGTAQVNHNDMMAVDDDPEHQPSSEEKAEAEDADTANLTPAQSRRKAQNRAAQRAFRERKEKRVRDLEDELKQYKENVSSLVADNDSLKRQIAKYATENEILRATVHGGNGAGANNGGGMGDMMRAKEEQITMGPLKYSPMDYTPIHNGNGTENRNANGNGCGNTKGANINNAASVTNGDEAAPEIKEEATPTVPHRVKVNETTGEKLLDASATWDLIVRHRSDANVTLDVQDIYERLKGKTQCDGTQPVIEEGLVRKAISDSAAAARSELL